MTGAVLVSVVQSAPDSVQMIVKGSFGSSTGTAPAVRSRFPSESTTPKRTPAATLAAFSCSVARLLTVTESTLPALSFRALTETWSMAAPERSNSALPYGSLFTLRATTSPLPLTTTCSSPPAASLNTGYSRITGAGCPAAGGGARGSIASTSSGSSEPTGAEMNSPTTVAY